MCKHISRATGVLLMATIGALSARADVIDLTAYTITFTGGPPLPTAGSFTYDQDTPHFMAFTVTWDSTTFDLTSSANAPNSFGHPFPACIGANTGAAASFALLSGACSPPTSGNPVQWFADSSGSGFEFFASTVVGNTTTNAIEIIGTASPIPGNETSAGGEWSIKAAAVPEPSTIVLIPATLLLLARKRTLHRLH